MDSILRSGSITETYSLLWSRLTSVK